MRVTLVMENKIQPLLSDFVSPQSFFLPHFSPFTFTLLRHLRPSEANQNLCLPLYTMTSLWSSESAFYCFYVAYLDDFPEEIFSPINFLITLKNMFHLGFFGMCGVVLGFFT